jgi:hypothetical protein
MNLSRRRSPPGERIGVNEFVVWRALLDAAGFLKVQEDRERTVDGRHASNIQRFSNKWRSVGQQTQENSPQNCHERTHSPSIAC